MKTRTRTLFAALLSALMILGALQTAAPAAAFAADGTVETLIVELEDSPAAPGAARAVKSRLLAKQQSVKARIRKSVAADLRGGYRFTQLLNGFTVRASVKDADAIRAMEGVKNVYVSKTRPAEKTEPASVLPTDASLAATEIGDLHAAGYKGEGQVIAVIDSGFDLSNSFLTAPPDDAAKMRFRSAAAVQARMDAGDMNADVSAAEAWHGAKAVFAWNYVTGDADVFVDAGNANHGTHVAGIAGGKNGKLEDGSAFNGMAPEAQLLLMANGRGDIYTDDAASLAALEDAVILGADVINMSWGLDYAENDVFDSVFRNADEAGVLLINAAGNAGRAFTAPDHADYGTTGSPGGSAGAFNVANAAVSPNLQSFLVLEANGERLEMADGSDDSLWEALARMGDLPYVYCGGRKDADVRGKAAVFPLNADLELAEKASREAAVSLFLEPPKDRGLTQDDQDWCAAFEDLFLRNGDGDFRLLYIPGEWGSANLKKDGVLRFSLDPFAGDAQILMNASSSWGVGRSLDLVPDVATPGTEIWSSVPADEEDPAIYGPLSGTSMAAPCMTGAAAVIRQYLIENSAAFAEKSPAAQAKEIRERVQSTADILYQPIENEGVRENSVPYSPRVQGAGFLQALNAVTTPVTLRKEPGEAKIALGEIGGAFTVSFTAENLSDRDVTYDTVGLALFTVQYDTARWGDAENVWQCSVNDADFRHSVSVSLPCALTGMPERVTVHASGETQIVFAVTPDADAVRALQKTYSNGFFVDGFVILSQSQGTDPALSIPFTGFYGDWSALPVLDADAPEGCDCRLLSSDTDLNGYLLAPGKFNTLIEDVEPGRNPFRDLLNPGEPLYPEDPEAHDLEEGVDDPAYPEDPDGPAYPEDPDGPAYPEDPDDPAYPEDPDGPAYPEDPEAPADPYEDPRLVGFDPEGVYDDPAFAGISPNGDGMSDSLRVQLYPLRSAAWSRLTVLDADGGTPAGIRPEKLCWVNVDYPETVSPAEKYAYGGSAALTRLWPNVFQLATAFDGSADDAMDEINAGTLAPGLPEGRYILRVEARFDEDAKRTDTVDLPFYVDVTAPSVDAAVVREDGKIFVDATVSDAFHVAAVGIFDADLGEYLLMHPAAGLAADSFRFDVTDLIPGAWEIRAIDYAGNETAEPLSIYSVTEIHGVAHTFSRAIGRPAAYMVNGADPEGSLTKLTVDDVTPDPKYWDISVNALHIDPAAFDGLEDGDHTLRFWFGDTVVEEPLRLTSAPYERGDVDYDGAVTAADARLALRAAVGLEWMTPGSLVFDVSDMDGDDSVSAADARLILRKAVGLK